MLDLYNAQFGHLLHIAARTRYAPTEGERALVYRVLSATYNPLGVYFALAGGMLAYRLGSPALPAAQRLTTALLCALYANEASWLLHEPHPTHAFFRDVAVVRGELGALASESTLVLPLLGFAFRSTALQQLLSTLTLRHTRYSVLESVQRPHSTERERWLALVGEQWLPYEDMDPLTYLYWSCKRARRRWRTRAT